MMSPMRVLTIAVLVAACSKSAGTPGTERGPCKSDHACEGGLVCLSDLCVRPPAGDCAQVAEALASVTLGNYAEKDARAKRVAELRAQCDRAELSVDDALCLTSAKSKYAMAKCPKPLLPELAALAKDQGGCTAVGAKMEALAKVEIAKDPNDPMTKLLPDILAAVVASCQEDEWPDDVKDCLVSAEPTDTHAADRCIEKMTPAVKDKFMKRIEAIVEKTVQSGAAMPPPPPAATMPAPTAPPAATP
jgi:hypothetical protein